MAEPSIVAKWSNWAPQLQSVLRIVAAAMFIVFGTTGLFAFPAGVPPNGGTVPLMSQAGLGAVLQVVGGGLLLLGLFTRPVAFVLSGEMAVAYFKAHAPSSFWPIVNKGELAVLFCFVFLYIAAHGSGGLSLDSTLRRRRA